LVKNSEFVIYKNWFCRVDEILYELKLQFKDGSTCIVKDVYEDDFSVDMFYPTLELEIEGNEMKKILKKAIWTKGSFKEKFDKAMIKEVKIYNVILDYLTNKNFDTTEVPIDIEVSQLESFSYFNYSNWGYEDICLLSDDVLNDDLSIEEKKNPPKTQNPIEKYTTENIGKIVKTKSYVDVKWQDGTITKNIETTKLMPVSFPGDHDFCILISYLRASRLYQKISRRKERGWNCSNL
jgi:ubiquitin-conjugating enzyme E2 O